MGAPIVVGFLVVPAASAGGLQTASAALGIYKAVENVALALVHVIVRFSILRVCPFPFLVALPLKEAVLLCSSVMYHWRAAHPSPRAALLASLVLPLVARAPRWATDLLPP